MQSPPQAFISLRSTVTDAFVGHTAAMRSALSKVRPIVEEIKVKLNGAEERFALELWRWAPREVVVGKWVAPVGNPYEIEAGGYSYGVWPLALGQRWGAYRIHAPDGELLKYRFDALEQPRAMEGSPRTIAFDDLLLDISATSPTAFTVEDEDEVAAAVASGALSAAQLREVETFRDEFVADPASFLRIVDAHIDTALRLDLDLDHSVNART